MIEETKGGQEASAGMSRRGLLLAGAGAGLAAMAGVSALRPDDAAAQEGPAVVQRGSVSLAAAVRLLGAGIAKAAEMGIPMNIVIVDESGVIKAQARMDGNSQASIDIVPAKARTAAYFRSPTHMIAAGLTDNPIRLASLSNLPWFTALGGGYPIGQGQGVAGGIGVGGGTPEQDMEVAQAALAALNG